MKAVVYDGANKVKIDDVEDPAIQKAKDVVVKISATAIGGADLNLLHGLVPNVSKGTIPGSEAMGTVVEAGAEVKGVKKGERVIIPLAKAGQAEYIRVPNADQRAVVIPDEFTDEQDDVGEYIKEITGGGVDCVIDCVGMGGKSSALEKIETTLKVHGGSKSALEIAAKSLKKGGSVTLLGQYYEPYKHFPLGDFFMKDISLRMGQCPVYNYIEPVFDLIKTNRFDATDIITHQMPLKEASEAYSMLDKKTDGCIKVILRP